MLSSIFVLHFMLINNYISNKLRKLESGPQSGYIYIGAPKVKKEFRITVAYRCITGNLITLTLKGTEVKNYFFAKDIKKYDEFKNGIKSF